MKIIKVFCLAVFAAAAAVSPALSFTARITDISGNVEYMKQNSEQWQEAALGLDLSNGDRVRSQENSWAEISFSLGHKARIGSNSSMLINQLGEKTSLELFKGSLMNKVRKLSQNQQYEVKTPQSVASVKGTEFTVVVGDEGVTQIRVLEGSVLAKEIETGSEVIVSAGMFTEVLKSRPPKAPKNLSEIGKQIGEKSEEKNKSASKEFKEELRNEIRNAVQEIKIDAEAARNIVEQKKQTDNSTGRTLTDVHGNLVRVSQHIIRPSLDRIQILNIVKRKTYKYKGAFDIEDTGARIDSVILSARFNKELPEKLTDWIGFLGKQNEDDFHLEEVSVELKNNVNGKTDKLITRSEWDPSAGENGDGEMADPVIKIVNASGEEWLLDMEEYDSTDPLSYNDGTEVMWDGPEYDDKLSTWFISNKVRIFKDLDGDNILDLGDELDNSKYVRWGVEAWVINNEGSVYGFDTFTGNGASSNPFEILRNIAFESSIVCRYNDSINNSILEAEDYDTDLLTSSDLNIIRQDFNKGENVFSNNLDLIATPDLAIPILEKIAKGSISSM